MRTLGTHACSTTRARESTRTFPAALRFRGSPSRVVPGWRQPLRPWDHCFNASGVQGEHGLRGRRPQASARPASWGGGSLALGRRGSGERGTSTLPSRKSAAAGGHARRGHSKRTSRAPLRTCPIRICGGGGGGSGGKGCGRGAGRGLEREAGIPSCRPAAASRAHPGLRCERAPAPGAGAWRSPLAMEVQHGRPGPGVWLARGRVECL